ncbi:cytochrome P450 [Bombardia bombarda]|uniref:Cytochrome P450 n=1 Tax=Bombardia bombarda TaxID=252184 RepID=A0AA39TLY6_9PEZI|nr:cytochrome P450 [Bombardia bombarda]
MTLPISEREVQTRFFRASSRMSWGKRQRGNVHSRVGICMGVYTKTLVEGYANWTCQQTGCYYPFSQKQSSRRSAQVISAKKDCLAIGGLCCGNRLSKEFADRIRMIDWRIEVSVEMLQFEWASCYRLGKLDFVLGTTTLVGTLAFAGVSCLVSAHPVQQPTSRWSLRRVRGPFWNSISVFHLATVASKGSISVANKALQKKYGPLVRIAPNVVMFGDAETDRRLSSVRSDFTKGPWYEPTKLALETDSIFTLREFAPRYAGREGAAFEPKADSYVAEFVDLIERKYISTPTDYRPIEFLDKVQFFALDTTADIGFGDAIGLLANDKDMHMHKYIEINDQESAYEKEMEASNLVTKRLAEGVEQGNDMLQTHIRNGLTKEDLLSEVFREISDSTAAAIRMTMLYLLNTPSVFEPLHREIDGGIAAERISSPIRDAEAYQMPYLQAVIKEGMRILPPSTGMNNKQVPKGRAHIQGYFLLEGTQLAANVMYMAHDQKVFGPDAELFRPER